MLILFCSLIAGQGSGGVLSVANPSQAAPSLPKAVEVVLPEWPSDLSLEKGADVYLRVGLKPDGTVDPQGITVVSSDRSDLSSLCVDAVKAWKFEAPGHSMKVMVHIRFRPGGKVLSDYPGADTR